MSDCEEEVASPPVKKRTLEMPKAFRPYTTNLTYSQTSKVFLIFQGWHTVLSLQWLLWQEFAYTFSTFDVMKQTFSFEKNKCAKADLCRLVLKEKKRIKPKTLFELQLLDRVTLYPLPERIFVIYYLKADVGADRPRCYCEGYLM